MVQNNSSFILEVTSEISLPQTILNKIGKNVGIDEARDCAMAVSVGGIGPLLRDRLIGQVNAGLDTVAVSLLYDHVWVQTRDRKGNILLLKKNAGKVLRKYLTKTDLSFELPMFNGEIIKVEVWGINYGQARGFLLFNPDITTVVYPGEADAPEGTKDPGYWAHEQKLKQGWMLGRGALTLTKLINKKPDVIVLSEAPTIFAHHKLFKDTLQKDSHFNKTKYVFNDHTPLEYAHPQWDKATIKLVHLDPKCFKKTSSWQADTHHVDVTALAVHHCEGVYGVAEKHGNVMKRMESLKPYKDKIQHITNGVLLEEWQAPDFKKYKGMSDEEILKIKLGRKNKLIEFVIKYSHLKRNWFDKNADKAIGILTRRITPYKRLDIINQMISDPILKKRFLDLNFIFLVGGRIHQQDKNGREYATTFTRRIVEDAEIRERLLFIDNFNTWESPILYQGADAAFMISNNYREASSTGFMKAQMNGAVVIATQDGAIPEFVNCDATDEDQNGFEVPYINDEPTAEGLLEAMESFNNAYRNPAKRIKLIRASLDQTPNVSIARTVNELKSFYAGLLAPNNETIKA